MTSRDRICIIIAIAILCNVLPAFAQDTDRASYEYNGKTLEVYTSHSDVPTTIDGRIIEESGFYFQKFRYAGNFYSINVPKGVFEKLSTEENEQLVVSVLDLYRRAFEKTSDLLGFAPEGYRFNSIFANTQKGNSFNVLYSISKISNIYTNFIPYNNPENPLTENQRWIILHEIGHSLFAISIGTIVNPKDKYMEEGVVDLLADEVLGEEFKYRNRGHSWKISSRQARDLDGLSQLDMDVSIWGKNRVLGKTGEEGYPGITHHGFGFEFINTFIAIFGEKDLAEFLIKFRSSGDIVGEKDYGTIRILKILSSMGYSSEEISAFEKELHIRLKKNIFITEPR